MIKEVGGDILLSGAQAIVHGVGPGDHFDRGLALALRERWPALARDFRHYCHTAHPKPGTAWLWGGTDGARIVTLLTHEAADGERNAGKPGPAHLEYVNHALRALRTMADEERFVSLAVPRLGTGTAGLSWEQVKPLILRQLGQLLIPVYLYADYHKGQRATE